LFFASILVIVRSSTPGAIVKSKLGILSILLTFTISLTAMAASNPGASLTLLDSSASPGKTDHVVSIDLVSELGAQVAAVSFDLSFDTAQLSFKGAAAGATAQDAGKDVASSIVSPGVVRVIVYGLNQTAIGDGTLLEMTFDIQAVASGVIPLSFSASVAAAPDASSVPLIVQNGTVTVQGTTFIDVPLGHWAFDEIEALYQTGYVAGCSSDPLMYCPESTMTRAESAVFVERGVHGAGYLPPSPTSGVFADVPLSEWFAKWAEGLWEDGYTAGCGTAPLMYCPLQEHTRAEGSVFFLRMLNGTSYQPAAATGIFADVNLSKWYAPWVESAYKAGLIPACESSPALKICPEGALDRATGAYMMVQAKGLNVK
jgi:hypothetical protein